jgi:hypothetical protein
MRRIPGKRHLSRPAIALAGEGTTHTLQLHVSVEYTHARIECQCRWPLRQFGSKGGPSARASRAGKAANELPLRGAFRDCAKNRKRKGPMRRILRGAPQTRR